MNHFCTFWYGHLLHVASFRGGGCSLQWAAEGDFVVAQVPAAPGQASHNDNTKTVPAPVVPARAGGAAYLAPGSGKALAGHPVVSHFAI